MTEASDSKRPRGRPRVIDAGWLREMRSLYPDIHTDRQLQNRDFAHTAMRILGLMPERADALPPATWLVDWDGANRGKQGAIKWAILEQLGRMAYDGFSDDSIREMAAAIERRRPSVKLGASLLRRERQIELSKAALSAAIAAGE